MPLALKQHQIFSVSSEKRDKIKNKPVKVRTRGILDNNISHIIKSYEYLYQWLKVVDAGGWVLDRHVDSDFESSSDEGAVFL